MSQEGNWSGLAPLKPWAWLRPWCSSPTWPCPMTVKPWLPWLASRASARFSSLSRSSPSWKTSSQRSYASARITCSPRSPISSTVSTDCVKNSFCGLSSGPNHSQVTALSMGIRWKPCTMYRTASRMANFGRERVNFMTVKQRNRNSVLQSSPLFS